MRLLNTPIIGISATRVAVSRIDMLAGLFGLASRRMPPRVCAQARWPAESANSSEPAARQLKYCFTRLSSLCSWLGRRRPATSRKAVTSKDTALPRRVMNSRRLIRSRVRRGCPGFAAALAGWRSILHQRALGWGVVRPDARPGRVAYSAIWMAIAGHGRSATGAQNRHADAVAACLLLGDERTWLGRGSKSENDPNRKSGSAASDEMPRLKTP